MRFHLFIERGETSLRKVCYVNGTESKQSRKLLFRHNRHHDLLQVVTQQEMLYNVDFRLQLMERQVSRAAGTRSDEETKQLNAKIAKLTEVLDGVNAEHAMLSSQVKKAEEDLSKQPAPILFAATHNNVIMCGIGLLG